MPVEGYGVVDHPAGECDVLTVANGEQVRRAGQGPGVQQSQESDRGQQSGRYRFMQKPEQKPNRRTGQKEEQKR
jgi:hypothetical protein